MQTRHRLWLLLAPALAALLPAQDLPIVAGVDAQPVLAQARRLAEALEFLGNSLRPADLERLEAISRDAPADAVTAVQRVLDPYCLAMVHINPESRVRVERGPAAAELLQGGWRSFLVKVHNQAGVRSQLEVVSPNAAPIFHRSTGEPRVQARNAIADGELLNRFLEVAMHRRRPLQERLSGLELEYAVLQIYSRDRGQREARIGFHVGQGSQDLGFRSLVDVLFHCRPAVRTVLRVKDHDGSPTMASFVITDEVDRGLEEGPATLIGVYPLPSRRLARDDEYPDFFFQPQVYRQDGEHVDLPPGKYRVTWTRGPEYLAQTRVVEIPKGVETHEETFQLRRWVHMAPLGWYSSDHHVHGAGCSHYESPAEGVLPEHMWRQGLGEDLNIACVLNWGPSWYHQQSFFDGKVHSLSTAENLMRYDVEVSGFPSSHAGHVCLLRLERDDYPGTTGIEEWPSWTLPVLDWARSQGAVVGYAHSGWGLEPMTETNELPNYVLPRYDGIGANEYVVTVALGSVDFFSAGDTPPQWELNMWYHTLNCGFRVPLSGETDYPCIFDRRVGMTRSYVKLEGGLDFDAFIRQLVRGRSYVSDGGSHLVDFIAGGVELGTAGSELRLTRPGKIEIKARAIAMLPEQAGSEQAQRFDNRRPYWDIAQARIPGSRQVPVELIVNGEAVARQEITADGTWTEISFAVQIDRSSWVALRVLPSSHTNPIFVLVGDQPLRASAQSAEWCLRGVDRCWEMKSPRIREHELPAARQAYDQAKSVYRRIMEEARTQDR